MPVAKPSLVVRNIDNTEAMLAGFSQDMREEKWTDVVLYTRERVPLPVHRLVLSTSTFLNGLLQSLSCCQGRCSNQDTISLLLPDINYQDLVKVIDFLYSGRLKCSQQERTRLLVILS